MAWFGGKNFELVRLPFEDENLPEKIDTQMDRFFTIRSIFDCNDAYGLNRIVSTTKDVLGKLEILKLPAIPDDVLVYVIVSKLDSITRSDWEKSLGGSKKPSTFDQLMAFLEARLHKLLASGDDENRQYSTNVLECRKSSNRQSSMESPSFPLDVSHRARHDEFFLIKQLCENCCLVSQAGPSSAPVADIVNLSANLPVSLQSNERPTVLVRSRNKSNSLSVLPTALVNLIATNGKEKRKRVHIDQQSQYSYITYQLANALKLQISPLSLKIPNRFKGKPKTVIGRTNITIKSRCTPQSVSVDALVVRSHHIGKFPRVYRPTRDWPHLRGLQLADGGSDDTFNKCNQFSLLLGADAFMDIVKPSRLLQADDGPIAQETIFGWILSGEIEPEESTN